VHGDASGRRTDARRVAEPRRDGAHLLLMPEDLRGDVAHAQLVERGLAHGRIALAARALDEVARVRALPVAHAFHGAAPDEIEIVAPALDELVGRELAGP
jgi:hypothetical protein